MLLQIQAAIPVKSQLHQNRLTSWAVFTSQIVPLYFILSKSWHAKSGIKLCHF